MLRSNAHGIDLISSLFRRNTRFGVNRALICSEQISLGPAASKPMGSFEQDLESPKYHPACLRSGQDGTSGLVEHQRGKQSKSVMSVATSRSSVICTSSGASLGSTRWVKIQRGGVKTSLYYFGDLAGDFEAWNKCRIQDKESANIDAIFKFGVSYGGAGEVKERDVCARWKVVRRSRKVLAKFWG